MALNARECNDAWRPRVAVAQIGARMHYAVPAVFARAGVLERLYTDLCAEVGWIRAARAVVPNRILPAGARRLFARTVRDVLQDQITCYTRFGLSRIFARDRANANGGMHRHLLEANRNFTTLVARDGLGDANVLYAFNGAALELLEHAKRNGIFTILEQISAPVGYDERMLAEERSRWPGWEVSNATDARDWSSLAERERAEWALADVIVCGSQYVVEAMRAEGGPIEKARVVPYAFEADASPIARSPREATLPLLVLCVATLQLRKGVQHLIETARLLRETGANVRIRLIGPSQISSSAMEELRGAVEVVGALPRDQVSREFAQADLFILPTLSEGSAIVCYEALAAGLPVITTPAAGSVVRDGMEGRIVPTRDPHALADAIRTLASDRALLANMSRRAAERAREFTWDQYGRRLMDIVNTAATKQVNSR